MINKRGFASDNNSGVHSEIIKAIIEANEGHTVAYGDDIYTERAKQKFYEHFGNDIDISVFDHLQAEEVEESKKYKIIRSLDELQSKIK